MAYKIYKGLLLSFILTSATHAGGLKIQAFGQVFDLPECYVYSIKEVHGDAKFICVDPRYSHGRIRTGKIENCELCYTKDYQSLFYKEMNKYTVSQYFYNPTLEKITLSQKPVVLFNDQEFIELWPHDDSWKSIFIKDN